MRPRNAAIAAVVVALVAVLAAVTALMTAGTSSGARRLLGGAAGLDRAEPVLPAPDLASLGGQWDNTPAPLTRQRLTGKVVLVDFWDASCINCRRTFPFLRRLQQVYGPQGLVIVGVHSPEFDFEKSHAYVVRSIHELGVTWPVVEDPDMRIWQAFSNLYWPANYFLDRTGAIRYRHAGEGDEDLIEGGVRSLLAEGGTVSSAGVGLVPETERPPSHGETVTPELYLGAARDNTSTYVTVKGPHASTAEWLTLEHGSSITLSFDAKDVYVINAPQGTAPVVLEVTLDGKPIPATRRGKDVVVTGDGRTLLRVTDDDLRHVVTGPGVESGRLVLTAVGGPVRFFTFTFGA